MPVGAARDKCQRRGGGVLCGGESGDGGMWGGRGWGGWGGGCWGGGGIGRTAGKRQAVDVVDCAGRCGRDIEIVSGADADSRCGELCAGIRRVKCGVATASYEC